jgi:sulfur carrier protein ThiS
MRIYLGGYLTFYAAGQSWVEVDVPAPARLRDILQRVNIPMGEIFLTAVNGTVANPDEVQVVQTDEVRLYPPVDGGALVQSRAVSVPCSEKKDSP